VIFLPRFTRLPPSYVLSVSTAHLVVRRLIGITRQTHTSGTARTYLTSEGSSMTCFTRVALRDSHGVSTILLTNPSPEHRTIFSHASMESQATKPSRRWQPPRVTSTTGLQHDHLVPLNTISWCNHTRIAYSLDRMNTIKLKWVRGLPNTSIQATKAQGCSTIAQGQPRGYLYASTRKEPLYPFMSQNRPIYTSSNMTVLV
jgi:hypothetical protein